MEKCCQRQRWPNCDTRQQAASCLARDTLYLRDHVPTMEGDNNDNPAYSSIGRLFAIGYIKGLREAVYGRKGED